MAADPVIRVRCLSRRFRYWPHKREYRRGAEFDVFERHAGKLLSQGVVERADTPVSAIPAPPAPVPEPGPAADTPEETKVSTPDLRGLPIGTKLVKRSAPAKKKAKKASKKKRKGKSTDGA